MMCPEMIVHKCSKQKKILIRLHLCTLHCASAIRVSLCEPHTYVKFGTYLIP